MNDGRKSAPIGRVVVEAILFNVKWVLPLFYLGLVIVMCLYGLAYAKEIVASVRHAPGVAIEEMKVVVLDFVDLVMVANLVKMIITGSYNSFVSKEHGRPNENISSGTLKIKISTTIVIVSSLNLLRSFVGAPGSADELRLKLWIFYAFLATTLVLGVLEYLHVSGQAIEADIEARDETPEL
jgi:uncharacterized protein (TIGR00645 family)